MPGPRTLADSGRANGPRVYDYLLGGKGSYAADRELAEELIAVHPELPDLARANRRFILAVTTRMAADGIGQFLDLGCGLPSSPMIHETARDANPWARVAYADHDAVVLKYAWAATRDADGVAVIGADVSDPASVTGHPALAGVIDLAEPVCVLLGGTLSGMDAQVAREAVAGYAKALAPGSAVAISCVSYRDETLGQRMAGLFSAAGSWRNHSQADIASFFGDLDPGGRGADDVSNWPLEPSCRRKAAAVTGGVGRP